MISDAERAVIDFVLGRESAHRDHVVVALSGAHAYGFPSPDSDLDMRPGLGAQDQLFRFVKRDSGQPGKTQGMRCLNRPTEPALATVANHLQGRFL